jgi:RNA polymerase sigma-70 factor (ECF subfamily)
VTRYHLEAGIAACHALAPEYAATNWRQIVELYDQLLEMDDSPVVALNRAVAVAQMDGPHAGLRALDEIKNRAVLERYHLLPAVAGQLWLETGETERARECFLRASGLAALPAERALLEKKLAECAR